MSLHDFRCTECDWENDECPVPVPVCPACGGRTEARLWLLVDGELQEAVTQEQKELAFILGEFPDEPMEWYFFSDEGERHTTHTTHEFFEFAHSHRGWGYTNVAPK